MISKHRGIFRQTIVVLFCGLLWWGCLGCSSPPPPGPPRKPTYPVTGTVTVDGQLVEMLEVACHDAKRLESGEAMIATAYTEGDYALTFLWGEFNVISRSYGGPDKLKDRYKSPQESKVKFTAKKGTPLDLGKIELTTK